MTRFGSSYYRNDLSGLGTDDQALSFADAALIALVSGTPSMIYAEWATQVDDVTWQDATNPKNYQAYAITDQELVTVASTTMAEVSRLAVIAPFLTRRDALEKAFEGTPFSYDHTESVYSATDPSTVPIAFYVYWLTLRDASDPKIGPTSLNYAATLVGGVLSYIVFIAPDASMRARPSATFQSVLGQQTALPSISIPQTPAVQTTIPSGSPAAPASSPSPLTQQAAQQAAVVASASDNMTALLLVGLGAGSAILAYRYFVSRKRTG